MLTNKKYISIKISEKDLHERNRDLSRLLEMNNLLSGSMDLKALLTGALSKVLEYFGIESGRVYLPDEKGGSLDLVAYYGLQPKGLEKITDIDESFSWKALRTRSFVAQHVSELKDKKRAALLFGKGFDIIICVPLIVMDKVIGVMNLSAGKDIKFDQDDVDLMVVLGNQIAVAFNNAQLYNELESKINTLKEKKDMIKFFAYSVSHDLKSPAVGVHGLARRLKEKFKDSLDYKAREYCDHILNASEQMVALAEKINDYISAKEVALNFERVQVKEATTIIRNEFSAILKQRHVKWTEPDTLPEIVADKLALLRVLQNFVDNTLKYGGDGLAEIKLGYEENDKFHIFSFSDDGIGIRKEDKEKIFEVFKREQTSRGTNGAGLGLAIVKEIAAGHQGRVWLEHGTKKGTNFYLTVSKKLTVTKQHPSVIALGN